jgi:hypothetical protein
VLATALLTAAASAQAAGRGGITSRHSPGLTLPGGQSITINRVSRIPDDVFNSDSCTTQPGPPRLNACVAVGYFGDAQFVVGLMEDSFNGKWSGNTFGSLQTVTDPIEVSCVNQQAGLPTCVAVGEHFTDPRFPAQLVSLGDANGFSPFAFSNPKGTTWSVLDDASCASTTFCVLVGSAGTTKRTSHGLRYIGHATAYRWNGTVLHTYSLPSPAHATAALAGVSCPSPTSCMAVGDYTTRTGRTLPYSLLLAGGTWHLHLASTIGGTVTLFQGVSCAAAAKCMAVGDAAQSGGKAFAEKYSNGTWSVLRVVPEPGSAFFGVSCPTTAYCVAVGKHRTKSLIEAWNGTRWALQGSPPTPAPLTTDVLFHVSCVAQATCTAVGYRHNPHVRFSFRTLALGWNGSKWAIQKTGNQ